MSDATPASPREAIEHWMNEYKPERTVLSAAKNAGSAYAVLELDDACLLYDKERTQYLRDWMAKHGDHGDDT